MYDVTWAWGECRRTAGGGGPAAGETGPHQAASPVRRAVGAQRPGRLGLTGRSHPYTGPWGPSGRGDWASPGGLTRTPGRGQAAQRPGRLGLTGRPHPYTGPWAGCSAAGETAPHRAASPVHRAVGRLLSGRGDWASPGGLTRTPGRGQAAQRPGRLRLTGRPHPYTGPWAGCPAAGETGPHQAASPVHRAVGAQRPGRLRLTRRPHPYTGPWAGCSAAGETAPHQAASPVHRAVGAQRPGRLRHTRRPHPYTGPWGPSGRGDSPGDLTCTPGRGQAAQRPGRLRLTRRPHPYTGPWAGCSAAGETGPHRAASPVHRAVGRLLSGRGDCASPGGLTRTPGRGQAAQRPGRLGLTRRPHPYTGPWAGCPAGGETGPHQAASPVHRAVGRLLSGRGDCASPGGLTRTPGRGQAAQRPGRLRLTGRPHPYTGRWGPSGRGDWASPGGLTRTPGRGGPAAGETGPHRAASPVHRAVGAQRRGDWASPGGLTRTPGRGQAAQRPGRLGLTRRPHPYTGPWAGCSAAVKGKAPSRLINRTTVAEKYRPPILAGFPSIRPYFSVLAIGFSLLL